MELNFEISQHFLDDRGQRSGFVLLGAFLLAFLFIRTSARLIRSPKITWWPGSVETKSGLHLHHLVWGLCLMMGSGFLNFALAPSSPGLELLAAAFGIGAGLTLDEFALWVRLEDVYWSQEGRISLDAGVVATPTSPWSRRRYAPDGKKLARAKARQARVQKRRTWLSDAIGGTPSAQ